MPKGKADTYEKILPAARQEFLEKGFEQASMRRIAARIGMSAAGLYRHFEDKEALFAVLVAPALEALDQCWDEKKKLSLQMLEQKEIDRLWENRIDEKFIDDVLYANLAAFKLLICCSSGTKYADFTHEIVVREQQDIEQFIAFAKSMGIPVREIWPEALHLLISAYMSAFFEVIVHDFTRDEAVRYINILQEFFTPGWSNVLGI